jgi:hypothetical protein
LKIRAAEMKDSAKSVLNQMTKPERESLNDKFLAKIGLAMDKLSRRWSVLRIGQYLTLEWPRRK